MARKRRKDWLQFGSGKGYFDRTHYPLQCLIFISPLLMFYQIGTALHPWNPQEQGTPTHVVAFKLMQDFFNLFGAAGNYLPLLAVVAILLSWHAARKDKWDFDPKLYLGMAGESVLLAIPVFVMGLAIFRKAGVTVPGAMAWIETLAQTQTLPFQTQVVISVGAGIYEELIFRLIAIVILNIILVDVFDMKVPTAIPVIIVISAILFSLYHYLGNESFNLSFFAFRVGFGIYLAGIYIYRGFGITVGCHAVYDLILAFAEHWRSGQ